MNWKLYVTFLFLLGCTEIQQPREMEFLLGEWIGESEQLFFSECGEGVEQNIAFTANKLIVEPTSIREISEFISMNESKQAIKKMHEISGLDFTAPVDGELQHGFHVSAYELNVPKGWLEPPGFDIKTSGLDLRKRIVSLTKNQLILERTMAKHASNSCYGEVDQRTVYSRYK